MGKAAEVVDGVVELGGSNYKAGFSKETAAPPKVPEKTLEEINDLGDLAELLKNTSGRGKKQRI